MVIDLLHDNGILYLRETCWQWFSTVGAMAKIRTIKGLSGVGLPAILFEHLSHFQSR